MKNKLKIVGVGCCALIGVLAIIGAVCVKQPEAEMENSRDTASVSDDAGIYIVSTTSDLAIDIASPAEMAKVSQYIALITIDSIDGCDNYSEVSQQYVSPYTYGTMTVLQNLKGELPVGENLRFYRLGGTLPIERYYEGLSSVEKERFDFAKNNNDNLASAEWVKVIDTEDIDIDPGKTYLVYMVAESAYHAKPNTYTIIGYQGGLREAKFSDNRTRQVTDIKILDNFTGEWEDLNNITIAE